jgi:hypothetical protein
MRSGESCPIGILGLGGPRRRPRSVPRAVTINRRLSVLKSWRSNAWGRGDVKSTRLFYRHRRSATLPVIELPPNTRDIADLPRSPDTGTVICPHHLLATLRERRAAVVGNRPGAGFPVSSRSGPHRLLSRAAVEIRIDREPESLIEITSAADLRGRARARSPSGPCPTGVRLYRGPRAKPLEHDSPGFEKKNNLRAGACPCMKRGPMHDATGSRFRRIALFTASAPAAAVNRRRQYAARDGDTGNNEPLMNHGRRVAGNPRPRPHSMTSVGAVEASLYNAQNAIASTWCARQGT